MTEILIVLPAYLIALKHRPAEDKARLKHTDESDTVGNRDKFRSLDAAGDGKRLSPSLCHPEYGLPVEGRNCTSAGGLHVGDDKRRTAIVRPAEHVVRRCVVLADPPGVDARFEKPYHVDNRSLP